MALAQGSGGETVRTRAELARALDASVRTVSRWVARGLPRLADGSFDIDAARIWVEDMRQAGDARKGPANVHAETEDHGERSTAAAASSPDDAATKAELLARKRRADVAWREARARREQLTYEQAKGQLVDRDSVAELLKERAGAFRRELEAMTRRLARPLSKAKSASDVQRQLLAAVHQVLRSTYERPAPTHSPRRRRR